MRKPLYADRRHRWVSGGLKDDHYYHYTCRACEIKAKRVDLDWAIEQTFKSARPLIVANIFKANHLLRSPKKDLKKE